MSVEQFLAQQRASFVLAKDLIAEIQQADGCIQQEAAKALAICLKLAAENAPKWHSWAGSQVPRELTDEEDLRCARLMLSQLEDAPSDRLYNPEADIETAVWSNDDPLMLHIGVWQAYRYFGFLAAEIRPLLEENGLLPLGAEKEPALDATTGRSASPPLTLEEKREIVRLKGEGLRVSDLAQKFRKSPKTIYNVLNAARKSPISPDPTIFSRRR